MRVLIVDDEEDIRSVLRLALETHDCEVIEQDGATDIVAVARNENRTPSS